MKGTVHKIHTDKWIFKIHQNIGKDLIPFRFPFLNESLEEFKDGVEIEGLIVMIEGVEWIKKRG
jgi:hypothetical protein